MHNFKVGDKVRCINNNYIDNLVKLSQEYVVTLGNHFPWPYSSEEGIEVEGVTNPLKANRFELATRNESKFKTGDRVRVIHPDGYNSLKPGSEHIVTDGLVGIGNIRIDFQYFPLGN